MKRKGGVEAAYENSDTSETAALGPGRTFFLFVGLLPMVGWGVLLYFQPELRKQLVTETQSLRVFFSRNQANEASSPKEKKTETNG
jgi:hypothetical protein